MKKIGKIVLGGGVRGQSLDTSNKNIVYEKNATWTGDCHRM